jgi:hypothetical protein
MLFRTILLFLSGAVLNCCSAQLAGNSTNGSNHSENLSAYRPKVPVDSSKKGTDSSTSASTKTYVSTPVLNVNKQVDTVLDSIDKQNQLKKFVDGYTLQIYSGTNREEAMETKKKMSADVPDIISNLQYDQPKFRVTAGAYFTRLEAQKDFTRLKRFFPNTILVPERVPIK